MADDTGDLARIKYGFWLIIVGFGVVLLTFIFCIENWKDAKDVAAVVGAVTGIVGTLAGAFFGVNVGALGKAKADQAAAQAQAKVERLAALLPPADAARALDISDAP